MYKHTYRYPTHLLPPGGLPEMETAASLKGTCNLTSKISCILWARAEGMSGWAQVVRRCLQEMEYELLNCLIHFEINFYSLAANKQKKRIFLSFWGVSWNRGGWAIQYCSGVININKLLPSSGLSKNLKYSFHSLPCHNQQQQKKGFYKCTLKY